MAVALKILFFRMSELEILKSLNKLALQPGFRATIVNVRLRTRRMPARQFELAKPPILSLT